MKAGISGNFSGKERRKSIIKNLKNFSLEPFPLSEDAGNLKVQGWTANRDNNFEISFKLLGILHEVSIPAISKIPLRKDLLWQETCFEFFIGVKDLKKYWEFNLSPSGHWNVYSFEDYRTGMQEEKSFNSLPFMVDYKPGCLKLFIRLNLNKLISEARTLEINICSVIKLVPGVRTFWALKHLGPEPDFHLRGGWMENF